MVNIMNWRKSSYSGDNSGNCVEVAGSGNRVLVRDTNDRNGAMLRLSPDAWHRFAAKVKGERSLASDPTDSQ
jgi:Domain of unknown function (DUF397)